MMRSGANNCGRRRRCERRRWQGDRSSTPRSPVARPASPAARASMAGLRSERVAADGFGGLLRLLGTLGTAVLCSRSLKEH